MILKPRHYRKLFNIMCLTRAPLASFSSLKKAYRPVILSKWFDEIRTFQYEDHHSTILAEYIQEKKIKQQVAKSLKSLKNIDSQFKQNEFNQDYDGLIKEYFTEGSQIDLDLVFTQARFVDETRGKQNEKTKYFPTSFTTKIIFQQAYQCMFVRGKPFKNIFVGTPGISKSFSFSFLTKISNEINQYIFQNTQDDYCKRLFEADLITRIPKFIYWNVPIEPNILDSDVIETLKAQFSQLKDQIKKNPKNQEEQQEIQEINNEENLLIFIQNIRQFYKKKGILIVPIIDQINTFLKMKRKWINYLMDKNQLKDKNSQGVIMERETLQTNIQKTQRDLRKILNVIQKCKQLNKSGHCFFICSSTGQVRLMGQGIEPYRGKDIHKYSSQFVVASQRGHGILHKTQMNFLKNFYKDKEVRSELFNYLIFQYDQFNNLKKKDQNKDQKKDNHKEENQLSSLRQFLDLNKQFKKELQQKFMSYQWMPSQITFLQIREILSQKIKKTKENKNLFLIKKLSKKESNEENFKIIREEFEQLFNQMEECGQISLIQKIRNFVQKDHETVNLQRIQAMRIFNQTAEKYEIQERQQLKFVKKEQMPQIKKKLIQNKFCLVLPYSLESVLKKEIYSKDFFTFQQKSLNKTLVRPVITPKMLLQTIWPQIVIQRAILTKQWLQRQLNLVHFENFLAFEKLLSSAFGDPTTYVRLYFKNKIKFSLQVNSSCKTFLNLLNDKDNNHKIGSSLKDVFYEAQEKIGTCELYTPHNKNQPNVHTRTNPFFDMFFVKYLQADQSSDKFTKIVFYTIDATIGKNGTKKKNTTYLEFIARMGRFYTDKTQNNEFIIIDGFAVQFINIVIGHRFPTQEIIISRNVGNECLFYRQAYDLNIKDIKFTKPNKFAQLLIGIINQVKLRKSQ